MKRLLVTLLFVLIQSYIYCGSLDVRLFIENTPLPVKGARIHLNDSGYTSNDQGRLLISDLISGNYKVKVDAAGYDMQEKVVVVDGETKITFFLTLKTIVKANAQTVTADKEKSKVSYYNIQQKPLKRLSESTLFSDLFTSIQMLPGVASNGSFDATMYIRGGASYEVLGVIDDIPINEPYFFGGRLSLFNPKTAQNVEFYPGGYDVRYTQSLSGVVDVHTIDGSLKKSQGFVDVNLTEVNILNHGPIKEGKSSYLWAYRRTYYDIFAPLFISSESGKVDLPYLTNFQFKYLNKLSDIHTLRSGVYVFKEGANTPLDAVSDSDVGRMVYDASRIILSSQLSSTISDKVFNKSTLAYQTYDVNFKLTNENNVEVIADQPVISLINDTTYQLNDKHLLRTGGFAYITWVEEWGNFSRTSKNQTIDPDKNALIQDLDATYTVKETAFMSGAYLQDEWSISPKHELTTGVRVDGIKITPYGKKIYASPRLTYKYFWDDQTTLKAYTGEFKQQTFRLVNFEYKGLNKLEGHIPDIGMEKATHYGLGVDRYLSSSTLFKAEVFYKYYQDLITDVGSYPNQTYINKGVGKAEGLELMLQRFDHKTLEGWITYTYSSTKRKLTKDWYVPDYDVTHALNIYSEYKLKNKDKLISIFKWSTGKPYTPVLSETVDTNTGQRSFNYAKRGSKRLTDYIRVDLWKESDDVSLIYPLPFLTLKEKRKWLGFIPIWVYKGKTRAGVYNLLNTQNETSYYWDSDEKDGLNGIDLSRMPFFGYKILF